ncbi:MAG: hypothetical protein JO149_07030, partial [Gammaproteobacteria bacterium]|nr:hypothetical protein [Gammaproteobacteria bacterium]
CRHIDQVVKLAEAEGNKILSISKSELMDNVIWMNNQLSKELRDKIMIEMNNLDYEKTKDMPHDPATEYFVCEECKTVVIFPVQTAK